jgi:hypothetical protein
MDKFGIFNIGPPEQASDVRPAASTRPGPGTPPPPPVPDPPIGPDTSDEPDTIEQVPGWSLDDYQLDTVSSHRGAPVPVPMIGVLPFAGVVISAGTTLVPAGECRRIGGEFQGRPTILGVLMAQIGGAVGDLRIVSTEGSTVTGPALPLESFADARMYPLRSIVLLNTTGAPASVSYMFVGYPELTP